MTNAEMYQGQLEQARKRKRELWRYVKEIRARIKELKPGQGRMGLELELLEAKDRHAQMVAMEREAREKLREVV